MPELVICTVRSSICPMTQRLGRALLEAAHVEQAGRVDLPAVDVGDPGHRDEDPSPAEDLGDHPEHPRLGDLRAHRHHEVAHLAHLVALGVEDRQPDQSGHVDADGRGAHVRTRYRRTRRDACTSMRCEAVAADLYSAHVRDPSSARPAALCWCSPRSALTACGSDEPEAEDDASSTTTASASTGHVRCHPGTPRLRHDLAGRRDHPPGVRRLRRRRPAVRQAGRASVLLRAAHRPLRRPVLRRCRRHRPRGDDRRSSRTAEYRAAVLRCRA